MTMVFSAEWFQENQERLLRYANTGYGRRVLRIHGKRSAVGTKRIIKIEPQAITWSNGDGTYSTEFRSHAKFAKRLYQAYKPLWYAMHAWDMAVANRLTESLNLGFDTLLAYPAAGTLALTTDGYLFRQSDAGESFSNIRSQVGTAANAADTRLLAGLYAHPTDSNEYQFLTRSILTFDSSSIIAGTVTAATLSLYMAAKSSTLGTDTLEITSANPNQNDKLAAADYQRLGSTSFASAAYGAVTLSTYNDFTLDASGRANINQTGISAYGACIGWDLNNSFGGTWAAGGTAVYSASSADVSGTSQDPKLLVTYTPDLRTSISGTLLTGGTVTPETTHYTSVSGTLLTGVQINLTKELSPVAGKQYVYRVYEEDGTYIGVWNDVTSELEYDQRLNTPGTTTRIQLARSVNTTTEKRDVLITDDDEPLTTDDDEELIANYTTNNTVGEDTDVDLNYNVDVYVHYGGFETLETDDGQILTDDEGEDLLFSIGAPLGRRIFSGWIMDYAATYGSTDGLEVTLMSHGSELGNQDINNAGTTTVSHSSVDHGQVIRNYLAMNTGQMGSGVTTVANTGETISPTVRLNTILEGIQSVYQQSPDGWYWYGNVAENEVYFQEKSAAPNHTFVLGAHIKSLKLSRSIENLKNDLAFVGGDTGGGVILYKRYTTTSPFTRKGLDRQTDRRVTLTSTADKRRDKTFARYSDAIYTTSVSIPAGVYNIEEIQLGEVITFANFGNFIDGLQLQIVSIHYSPNSVDLELGDLLERQSDIIDDIEGAVQEEQYESIPDAPA